jgi:hypothetical protein
MINKKGIALETAVALIIGIVFLVVVIFILLQTGLLSSFQTQIYGLTCTASAYGRSVLIGMIMQVWGPLSTVIEIIAVISGGLSGGTYALAKIGKTSLDLVRRLIKQAAIAGGGTALFALIGFLSISSILTYTALLPLVQSIPLFCPSVTIDVGTENQKASEPKFLGEIAAATTDCWNMYGSGALDPLFGVDPPNPRECRILETYVKNDTPMNVSRIYDYILVEYGKNWSLGEGKLFVYCNINNSFQKLGNNPTDWIGNCSFDQARIYVMYRDKHDYDLLSYGTAVCNGKIDTGDFDNVNDVIVWCIESI